MGTPRAIILIPAVSTTTRPTLSLARGTAPPCHAWAPHSHTVIHDDDGSASSETRALLRAAAPSSSSSLLPSSSRFRLPL